MSLKKFVVLMLVCMLVLSILPLTFAAQSAEEATEATDTADAPAEKSEGIPRIWAAAIFALVATFLQNKFIHGRR